MKSFGLIFVLYNPSEDFLDNLLEVRTACPNVIAVDNSPEANMLLHQHLGGRGIQVIFNGNQGGLAGAYNRGAEVLLAQACDMIFLLDQDSDIEKTFFTDMIEAADGLGTDTFLIGPKIFEIKLQRCMPVIPLGKHFPKPIRIDDKATGLFSTMCIISSGSAISAPAYRKLGAFREDYFIEYIDVEYSLRAISQNVPVYVNAAVTLRQSNGDIERRGKLFSTHHAAWRRYYVARNMVHCLRLYRSSCGLHWLSGLMAIQQALTVLLFDSEKLEKVTAIACGYLDGMFGRLGTFEWRHRYLDAFCRRTECKGVAIARGSSLMATGDEL
jgi:rhamnosyltransferase